MAGGRDRELAAFVDARGGELTRLAHLLTGDAERARAVLVDALGTVHRHWSQAQADDLDRAVRTALVRTAVGTSRRRRTKDAPRAAAAPASVLTGSAAGSASVAAPSTGVGPTVATAPTAAAPSGLDLWGALAALTPRQRTAVVLRYSQDLDDHAAAELLGVRRAAVAADRTSAMRELAVSSTGVPGGRPDARSAPVPAPVIASPPLRGSAPMGRTSAEAPVERALREVLADPPGAPAAPADLTLRVLASTRAHRRRTRRVLAAVVAVAALVAAAVVVVPRLTGGTNDDPEAAPPPPPAATDPRLVGWQPRGRLAGDPAFLAEVAQVWREAPGVSARPGPQVAVLWAGTIGAGRLALVQSVSEQGEALVAQVADHDGGLEVDRVDPLAEEDPPAFVLDYDGDLDLPAVSLGPGANLLALVVAPGDEELTAYRRDRAAALGELVPGAGFRELELRADGLSDSWLHLSAQERTGTVVALVSGDGPLAGRISTISALPTQLAPGVPLVGLAVDPWGPGPNGDLGVYDDALVAARSSTAGGPPVTAAVLWSGRIDDYRAAVLRVEGPAGAGLELSLRRRGIGICHSRVPLTSALGTSVLLTCTGRTDSYTVLVGATPDTRVTLVDAATGEESATGVGAVSVRTEPGATPPVAAAGS